MTTKDFKDDWITGRCDYWHALFDHLKGKPHLVGLEIGCHEGRSACWFMDHVLTHETSRLICIDPWIWGPDRERRFDANIAEYVPRIEKRKGYSRHLLQSLPDDSLDFAYVDGSHRAMDTLSDGVAVFYAIKAGGIIVFDDYGLNRESLKDPPRYAVDGFLIAAKGRVQVLYRGYQVAMRKVG
jgi:predicted O-methyltransferase YrrM